MNTFIIIISAVICYLFGSVSSSIITGKCLGLGDVRKHGSGNAGATNALRVFGKKAAIFTVVGDILKTVIAVLIARLLAKHFITDPMLSVVSVYISCFCVALGHNFPVFFKFHGGKGVLTSGVIIIMVSPLFGTITVLCCLLVMALTKYVSLGSMTGGVLFPILVLIFNTDDIAKVVFSLILGAMLIIRHSANIKRLVNGTESKFGAKKEQK